jgi:ABC-type nickel/cobalt efflux system permease component RcnA
MAGKARIPLLVLAVAVGFLHGFTPGHGKALVGAFLIANQGTTVHAFFLGIVLTLTHTISIYGFGLLASFAAGLLLPGELIPLLSLLCGLFIVFIGVRGFVKRMMGTGTDHAHLLPNLQILRPETVNILIDGEAAEASEALLIAQEDELVQESLKAAGAEDFTLCSPGCSSHGRLPPFIRERRRIELFKTAVKTGAVDAVVTRTAENPKEILFSAIRGFSARGEITMPENRLSWAQVVSLGVSGGIVPCPDALAVLLLAVAAGKTALGMGIIFFFSLGLAAALILVGMLFVMTKRILAGGRRFAAVTRYLPYASSLVITILGIFMIKSSVVF